MRPFPARVRVLQAVLAGFVGASAAAWNEPVRPWVAALDDGLTPAHGALSAVAPGAYDLEDLALARRAIGLVEEGYVDPSRVDPERMYVAALARVEAVVPAATLRRAGSEVRLQLGAWRGVLTVPPLRRLDELTGRLAEIAALVVAHLGPDEIPVEDPRLDPFTQVELALVNGALSTLDPHSTVLAPAAWREMEVDNQGEFGGLGVHLHQEDGRLILDHVSPGTPAERGGLRPGDVLRRVDGAPLLNLPFDDAVELLRGPVGAPVHLDVLRPTPDGGVVPLSVVLFRAPIATAPVDVRRVDVGDGRQVAVARVRSFHADVAEDLAAGLASAGAGGPLQGVVLDLRDNPGGYLSQAIRVADLFLAAGEIVSTRGARDAAPRTERAAAHGEPGAGEPDLRWAERAPMVVLVDAGSASASEIVAGALLRNDRAVVVGERTFGKGSVQNLHAMPIETRLKLTVAHYLTPGGHSIQETGVVPDVELLPVDVRTAGAGGAGDGPVVRVFGSERRHREADLAVHLPPWRPAGALVEPAVPSWSFRYLAPPPPGPGAEDQPPDPAADPVLRAAAALIAAGDSAAAAGRRSGLLGAAPAALARVGESLQAEVQAAMRSAGVDWRPGPSPDRLGLEARLVTEPPPDDAGLAARFGLPVLVAGATTKLRLDVRRPPALSGGDAEVDAHRIVGVLSGHPAVDGLEFPIGRLPVGGEASWTAGVALPAGTPSELAHLVVTWRDEGGRALGEVSLRARIVGSDRPRLAWTVWADGGADGRVAPGEDVRLPVRVTNLGDGPAEGLAVRLRSLGGSALDLVDGDVVIDHLAAGATLEGAFVVRPLVALGGGAGEGVRAGWPLEVVVDGAGPAALHDGEGPQIPGLGEAAARLLLPVGLAPEAPLASRQPPRWVWSATGGETLVASGGAVSWSGEVLDDGAVRRLLVYQGSTKILARSAEGVGRLPFAVDAVLTPGRNVFTLVAVDDEGISAVEERVVWSPPAEVALGR